MVERGELDSLVPVGVVGGAQGPVDRPRIESDGGAFFGEEDVVQVGEDGGEPFAGPILALVDEAFAGPGFGGRGSV